MKRSKRCALWFAVLSSLTSLMLLNSCATQFTGDAKVDRAYCQNQCRAWDMELTGMFAAGEYSNGCICEAKAKDGKQSAALGSAIQAPAAVGAILQMRVAQQQAASMHVIH